MRLLRWKLRQKMHKVCKLNLMFYVYEIRVEILIAKNSKNISTNNYQVHAPFQGGRDQFFVHNLSGCWFSFSLVVIWVLLPFKSCNFLLANVFVCLFYVLWVQFKSILDNMSYDCCISWIEQFKQTSLTTMWFVCIYWFVLEIN